MCPTYQEMCPTHQEMCPTHQEMCPTHQEMYPATLLHLLLSGKQRNRLVEMSLVF